MTVLTVQQARLSPPQSVSWTQCQGGHWRHQGTTGDQHGDQDRRTDSLSDGDSPHLPQSPCQTDTSDCYQWSGLVMVPCRPIFTRLGGKLLLLLITNHKQCQQSQTGNIERASVNTFSLLISNYSLALPRYGLMSTGQCRLLTIYDKIILVNSTLIVNFNLIATSMEMSMKYLRHSLTAHII